MKRLRRAICRMSCILLRRTTRNLLERFLIVVLENEKG